MANIVPRTSGGLTPVRVNRRQLRELREVDGAAAVELAKLDHQTQLGTQRARTVARVGTRTMEAQAVVSMTERMIVEMEPGAVHGVSYLSQRLTIGLGQVIDKTIDEVA